MQEEVLPRISAGLVVNRRRFIRTVGAGCLALATAGSITSCEAAFNPAVADWLAQIAVAVGAVEVENVIQGGLKRAWEAWRSGVDHSAKSQAPSYPYCGRVGWCHPVPPVVMVRVSKASVADPWTDRLVACVDRGAAAVVFKPWALQTLSMFVHSITDGKTGDDLAQAQALCVLTLIPSGVRPNSGQSPGGTVGWMTYGSRNGTVEISWAEGSDGSLNGIITASAIRDSQGNPITKTFPLPTRPG